MKLVIAEKPSVAMALASVLGARTRKDGYVEGNGYIVSWCVGHLVGLCDASEYDEKYKKWRYEDLPIVPECWKHKILEGTKKQFGILKKLMRDSKVDEVICATDAGREGELIFRLVYEQAGCKKPMKRLWISSMEEQAIKDGFASLKDGSCYDSLYQSALCRAKADWLVGINASRLFSVLYNQNLKVGRVQTPTLAMIVDRNQKIKEFTKEKYYMAHIKFDDMDAVTEHFQKKEDASLDDEPIPTVLGPEAKDKLKMEAAAVGASTIGALALGPVGLVGGFFVKGKDVELPAGSELYIQTQKDVTTKGLVTASGAPNMVLRKRVAKSAVAGEAGSTMASDAGSSVNTVENMRNELKFVNEDGDEIDTKTKKVKSDAEETKADVSGTAEKAADEGEENASVVIVRNE